MGPSTTPPWRLIESPAEGDGATTAPTPPAATPQGMPGLDPALLKTAGLLGAAVVLGFIAFVLAFTSGSGDGVAVDIDGVGPNGSSAVVAEGSPSGELVVEVAGAVARPGVFRLPAGSRVADLIAAAGGYGPRVDTVRVDAELNLAATIQDGDRVRVASRDDPSAAPRGSAGATGGDIGGDTGGPIDLNRATAEQLDTLPGIGPVTAAKILAAREEAPFASVDDLRTRGILGEKTFERIRELVSVP